jgi:ATP synthase protein I
VDKETRKLTIQMAYVSSIGIAMALAIFGCLFLGIWLDSKLGTKPWFTYLLLLIGIAAGFRNMYLLMKPYLKDEKPQSTDVKSELHRERPPPEED